MKKITVENIDSTKEEMELINAFDVKELSRNFAILSKGEALGEGMSKVYISEVLEEAPGIYKLVGITDESVWDKVKQAMKDLVQGVETACCMKLDNGIIKLDSYRVIGIKDTDKEKLVNAYNKKVSSFTETPEVVSEPMIQNQPIADVVPEIMPEVTVETPAVAPVVEQVQPIQPIENAISPEVVEPIVPIMPEVTVNDTMTPQPAEEIKPIPNMFDVPETPNPEFNEPTGIEPAQGTQMTDDVQGGTVNNMTSELDTPQNFFEKSLESNDVVMDKESTTNSYVSDDPAIIMIDNVRKIIEDKNAMIKALNSKIEVLEGQLNKVLEEKKINDAQVAAETPLAQTPIQGPTLAYANPSIPNTNYNQAA